MLSDKKIKQLAEARKHIQHKPLSDETKQRISKANNGNFYGLAFMFACVNLIFRFGKAEKALKERKDK